MKIVLTKSQWERLSEIACNMGYMSFGSIVIPYVLGKPDAITMVLGLVISVGMWYISIVIASKYKI